MKNQEAILEFCLEAGAYKAAVLPVERIPFDKSLRAYCEANYCGSYKKNYACPPSVGDPDTVIAKARGYQEALVFQTVGNLEDSFDVEGMEEAGKRHNAVAEAIRGRIEAQEEQFLQLTAGGCSVCPVCAKVEDKPCRFPERAISSLEAYCMNVSELAGLCKMRYINGQNTVTYFGMFLLRG
ncbi:DUF2284 domain-containing protein [Bianquea renquensis]|jgi:hypothetical protein|uniref:DUF2284 domain-containing protein n=1 Tax=Bianquea renquensis TaxID=2763661 RepID=A0A926DQG8_9FIRM|nr:DUF2284 domain-containing protein [Bianquea renquensis]MBC8541947.1 DUF2284 domain-containing protein [Bianquea renquensis]